MKRTQAWLSVVALGVALGLACSPSSEGLLVNVQTEFTPGLEFDAVRVSLDDGTQQEVGVRDVDRFVESRRVASYADAPHGRRRVTVHLVYRGGVVTTRVADFEFSGSYLLNVVLSRACADVNCSAGESCAGDRCVPRTCITGYEPSCPVGRCRVDSDCPSAVACAVARCLTGFCVALPNNDRCAAGEACRADRGCVMRPVEPDAGGVDAGGADAGGADVGGITPCGGRPAGDVCRPSQGDCDVEERCDGASSACPADAWAAAGVPCRFPAGDCDWLETCQGNSPHCTQDAVKASGTVCRAGAGLCDPAEVCDGSNPECPGDSNLPNGTPCDSACGRETCSDGRCVGGETCSSAWTCCDDTRCDPCDCTGCGA